MSLNEKASNEIPQTRTTSEEKQNNHIDKETGFKGPRGYDYEFPRRERREKKQPATAGEIVDRLFDICEKGDFSLKMLDFILHSLVIPKQFFIERVRSDCELTARFLKWFYASQGLINYSEITLLGNILVFCIEFENVPVVSDFRKKIGGNDIWSIDSRGKNDKFSDIINQRVQRVPLEEVEKVKQSVRNWYKKLETQFES